MIDGRKPGILISPRMKVMRRGLGGGFRFRKLNLAKVVRYHEEPEKNFFSHTVESGEYALLGGGDYGEIMGRERARNDVMESVRDLSAADAFYRALVLLEADRADEARPILDKLLTEDPNLAPARQLLESVK